MNGESHGKEGNDRKARKEGIDGKEGGFRWRGGVGWPIVRGDDDDEK
jgi:hypothetical protein